MVGTQSCATAGQAAGLGAPALGPGCCLLHPNCATKKSLERCQGQVLPPLFRQKSLQSREGQEAPARSAWQPAPDTTPSSPPAHCSADPCVSRGQTTPSRASWNSARPGLSQRDDLREKAAQTTAQEPSGLCQPALLDGLNSSETTRSAAHQPPLAAEQERNPGHDLPRGRGSRPAAAPS